MQLHGHVGRSPRHLAPVITDPEVWRALAEACSRVDQAKRAGKLISPGEALALAGPEARAKETLFSIGQAMAWATGCNQDQLLALLECRYPDASLTRTRAWRSDE